MTIFDTIKYPVSDLPTLEQLEAIPESIYIEWRTYGNFIRARKDPKEHLEMMTIRWNTLGYTTAEFERYYQISYLRKLIAEYEPV